MYIVDSIRFVPYKLSCSHVTATRIEFRTGSFPPAVSTGNGKNPAEEAAEEAEEEALAPPLALALPLLALGFWPPGGAPCWRLEDCQRYSPRARAQRATPWVSMHAYPGAGDGWVE